MSVTISKPTAETWIVDINESSAGPGDTIEIVFPAKERVPRRGRIMRISSVLVSGPASTVAPILSDSETDFTGPGVIIEAAPAATVDEFLGDGVRYGFSGNVLYHRLNPDTGSTNSGKTRYLITSGWDPFLDKQP